MEPDSHQSDDVPIDTGWDRDATPSVAVVEAVADERGRDPTAIPALGECLDTDALDALIDGPFSASERGVRVSFTYANTRVSLTSEGDVNVQLTDGGTSPGETADPSSSEELHEQLHQLLTAASRNGVPLEGGWTVRDSGGARDYDVHISAVAKPGNDETARTD